MHKQRIYMVNRFFDNSLIR